MLTAINHPGNPQSIKFAIEDHVSSLKMLVIVGQVLLHGGGLLLDKFVPSGICLFCHAQREFFPLFCFALQFIIYVKLTKVQVHC